MSKKLRFGVLSTANIGVKKVIPAMQKGRLTEVTAIASRDIGKAREAAKTLGIPTVYGSYDELLADPNIDAIYNPLPNQLHVPLTIKAAEAGKHVLCEKPISMTVAEAKTLIGVRDRTGVKIAEAFMVRCSQQWLRVRRLIDEGAIGDLRVVQAFFSYYNVDPNNIRNRVETGGGGVYDIGCYCIQAARFGFAAEPTRVVAALEIDPKMGTDRLASAILEFPAGQATFTCSTQLIAHQRFQFIGAKGRIEIQIPVNMPNDKPTRIFIDETGDLGGSGVRTETFSVEDQYASQGDAFANAVFENSQVPVPLEDAIANMAVIEAVFRSARSGHWEKPER